MQCPSSPETNEKKRGRKIKGRERSLIEKLDFLKEEVCRFFTDFRVLFDNNQAKRDCRNCTARAKVSGCFSKRRCTGLTQFAILHQQR